LSIIIIIINNKWRKYYEKEVIFSNFSESEKGILLSEDKGIKHKPFISHKILICLVESVVLLLFISSIVILIFKDLMTH
jgi:hypothetical protein